MADFTSFDNQDIRSWGVSMLTDAKLRNLKPEHKAYKVSDRDGLYVISLAAGLVSLRNNYHINGRQGTLLIGRYGAGGLIDSPRPSHT